LGNFEFAGSHLSLGQLGGNRFKVLMRDVSSSDDEHVSRKFVTLTRHMLGQRT
jgi:tRNA(Glu) U13 pseudouridine synthase TruD